MANQAMKLPPDYPRIVADGVAALRAVSKDVRLETTRRADAPELWLVVRDLEGLADRVGSLGDREWQGGFGTILLGGQDFGVLDELLTVGVPVRGTTVVPLTPDQSMSVARLRTFLQEYANRRYHSDAPAT